MAASVPSDPTRRRLGGPRLRSRDRGHRQASWGELFYDLVYVVIVAQIAHTIVLDPSPTALVRALVLFALVWWAWANEVLYSTRFDQDADRARRVFGTAQLVALVLLAAAIGRDASQDYRVIAAAYALVRTLQVVELWRAGRWVPEARPLTDFTVRGHGLAVALWWLGMPLPAPWCFVLWGSGLAVGIGTNVAGRRFDQAFPPHVSHLPERFGLFVILVLGETFLGLVAASSTLPVTVESALLVVLAVVMAGALWWIYFDRLDEEAVVALARPETARSRPFEVWLFAHLPLTAGLMVAGAGIDMLLAAEHAAEAIPAAAFLVGGVATFVLFEGVICSTAVGAGPPELRLTRGVTIRLIATALLAAAGVVLVTQHASPLLTLAVVDVVLAGVVALDDVFQRRAGIIRGVTGSLAGGPTRAPEAE